MATRAASAIDLRIGTAPKEVNMGYNIGFRDWPQNYSKTQTIEMELTPKTMKIKVVDIEFANPADPFDTITVSGEWEVAR